ncbi:MAG: hypothetical protein HFJ50_03610, partial [Clostridia bacterium]|nr:hypothetical protein [Clostridia bacterium]
KSTWVNTNSFILDKINPSVTIQAGTGTTNTIPVTIKASDANGIKSYKYEYKLQSETTWKTATYQNGSYTGLSDGKTYDLKVTVTDGAGRTNSAQTTGTTKVANTPPTSLTVNYSRKTTNSISVTARATDNEGGTLTYTIYTSENGTNWTSRGSNTGTTGNTVTVTANGLNSYTYYYWKVIVSDHGNLTKDSGQQTRRRTYCSGTTYYCNGPSMTTCTDCVGGYVVERSRNTL